MKTTTTAMTDPEIDSVLEERTSNALEKINRAREQTTFDELATRITDLIVSQCYVYSSNVPASVVASVIATEVTRLHKHKTLLHAVYKNLTRRIENNEL